MTQLSKQSIRRLCLDSKAPLIIPFNPDKTIINGKSAGLSSASYDVRIAHDLVLGVHPGIALHRLLLSYPWGFDSFKNDYKRIAEHNPPNFALAHTIEDFNMPPNVSAAVADKSTYARKFMSAFNTFFDPGFRGNATIELVNFSDEQLTFKAGDPLCQFIFSHLDEATEQPYTGKYQDQPKEPVAAKHELPHGMQQNGSIYSHPDCMFNSCPQPKLCLAHGCSNAMTERDH